MKETHVNKAQSQQPKQLQPEPGIIAIGASAGGLEALQEFLSHLPELSNTCIIVAQHLSPTHKSMLVHLLSRKTKLVVVEAASGKILQAIEVYITPPDKEITVAQNKIFLQKPSSSVGPKPSVDVLFHSLADEEHHRVVGIILSGTGSDGSSGVKAIKKSGGYVIAQEPETAKYDGMPLAAIHTGAVDAVLAPVKMGEEILEYLTDPMSIRKRQMSSDQDAPAMNKIFDLLGKRTGTDFSNYKSATIGRRLEKRMSMLNISTVEDYLHFIEKTPREVEEMFKMILIGVTAFFRDTEAYGALEDYLHKLVNNKTSNDPIRIWVPGCSTGEEAYSIAILLNRMLKEWVHQYNVQIFATDIDEKAIAIARKGVYPAAALENIPKEIFEQYFIKRGKEYELLKAVRSMVLFSKHDLIKNPPFLKLDLISCRNLLIYFNTALQQQIIPIFHYAINQDGYLFLGKSETVGQYNDLFSAVDTKNKIFQRKRGGNLHAIKFSAFKAQKHATPKPLVRREKRNLSIPEMVKETFFNTFEHPYVVVSEDHDIQEVSGDVRLFLSLSPGSIQVNLLKMVNQELQIEVRTVLTKAIKERTPVRSNIKRFELFGNYHFVRITAKPLIFTDTSEELFVVVFEKLDIEEFVVKGVVENAESVTDARVQELEQELAATKEHLQTYIEEIETSNEELQSLNEELQSTNEELQSSNEELETTNEELQSTNEEIQIAYQELKSVNEALERKEQEVRESQAKTKALLNNDLQAFLMIDVSYKILEFNHKAESTFSYLRNKKVRKGESIIDLIPPDHLESFISDFNKSVKGNIYSGEKMLTTASGEKRWFSVNYSPLVFEGEQVSNVSVSLLDITDLKQALSDLNASERLVNSVFNAVSTGICITDDKGRFVDVNEQYCKIYGYTREELMGRLFTMVVPSGQREKLQQLHDAFIEKGVEPPSEFDVVTKNGKTITIAVSAQPLVQPDGRRYKVTSVRDISREKEAEYEVKKHRNELEKILEQSLDIICTLNAEGEFVSVSAAAERIWGYGPEMLKDKTFTDLVHPDDHEKTTQAAVDIMAGTEMTNFENRYIRKDGTVVPIIWSARWDEEEQLLYCVARDASEQKAHLAEQAFFRSLEQVEREVMARSMSAEYSMQSVLEFYMQRLEDLLPPMKASILEVEQGYLYNIASPSLPKAFVQAISGSAIGAQAGSCGTAAYSKQKVIVSDISTDEHWENYKDLALPHGLQACWAQPVLNSEGTVIATFANYYETPRKPSPQETHVVDRSARLIGILLEKHNKDKEIRQSNERFEYVNKATNDAIYDWDITEDHIFWGESFNRLFGHVVSDEKFSIEKWASLVHPEDVEKTNDYLQLFLKDATRFSWNFQYRFQCSDGEYAYVEENGYVVRNQKGKPVRMIGVIRDISQQKQEEQRLRLLENVITHTNDAVMITEADSINEPGPRIIYVNEAFTRMSEYKADEVIGKTPRILQGSKTDRQELDRLRKALENWEPCEVTLLNYKKKGEAFWINFTVTPIADETGLFTHWVSIERDVSKKKNDELHKALLAKIGQLFSKNENLSDTLEQVLQHLMIFGDFNLAEAWIVDADQKHLKIMASVAGDESAKVFWQESVMLKTFRKGEGLPGIVWKTRQLKVWDKVDTRKTFTRRKAARAAGLRSALGVPMRYNGEVIGVLVFCTVQAAKKIEPYRDQYVQLEEFLGAELKRRQVEEELNRIFSASPDIICVAGLDGYFKKVNPAMSQLLGYTEEELLNLPIVDFVHPEDRQKTREELDALNRREGKSHFENRYLTKTGKVIWLSWSTKAFYDEGIVYTVAKDVTGQKEIEILLEQATSLSRIGSWEINLPENTMYWSNMTKQIHGVDSDYEPDLDTAINFYREDVRDIVKNAIQEGMAGKPWDFELPLIRPDGQERWVRAIGQAEMRNGQCVRFFGSFQDIHQRKVVEIALEAAFEEKNSILESISDAFFAVDRNWTVTYWNNTAEKFLGKKRENILGKNLWEEYEDAVDLDFYSQYHKAVETGKAVHFEEHYPTLNIWFEVSAYPSSRGLSVYFKDVSERKLAEEQIRMSNDRFEKVTQATQDAIWDWDIKNDTLLRGGGFKTLFGYEAGKITLSLPTWKEHIYPDDQEEVLPKLVKVIESQNENHFQAEYRYEKADGSFATVIDRGIVIRDARGEAVRMVGAMTDISERKLHEESLKHLNETLEERAKELAVSNAELEQFAYVASHDLQEPLRMVSSFLTQLEKKYSSHLDEKALRYIHFAVDGAGRMRQIILDLLDFSRVGKHDDRKELLDFREIVDEVLLLQHKNIEEKKAKIEIRDLPQIRAYRSPVLQVFQNLIGNALKYSKAGVPPKIIIESKELDKEWKFSIKDNGIGIDPDYFEKIFIIFHRLHNKDEYSGTGMGLAIVKKIMEGMGGRVWVTSEEGKSSTFYFTIPKE